MKAPKMEIIKFVLVMMVFIAGMIAMMINHITQVWIWTVYIIVWTYTEMYVAKGFHLKWWHWALIIIGLSVLDLIIISVIR